MLSKVLDLCNPHFRESQEVFPPDSKKFTSQDLDELVLVAETQFAAVLGQKPISVKLDRYLCAMTLPWLLLVVMTAAGSRCNIERINNTFPSQVGQVGMASLPGEV